MNTPHICIGVAPIGGPSQLVSIGAQRRGLRRREGKVRPLARAAALAMLLGTAAVATADDLDGEPGPDYPPQRSRRG